MEFPSLFRPGHRASLRPSKVWPASAQGLLRQGAHWLRGGMRGGWGADLLSLPGGSTLEARWREGAWRLAKDGGEVPGTPFEALEREVRESPLPWTGAISFELCCAEGGMPHKVPAEGALGMLWRSAPCMLIVREGSSEIWSFEGPVDPGAWEARLGAACRLGRATLGPVVPRWEETRHRAEVEAIRASIHDGAFYVANLCVPFDGELQGDLETFALAAFRRARPPFGALLDLGGLRLLSLSMERLLSLGHGRLRSQPIKGTAPLTGNTTLDGAAATRMRSDPKELAEHRMILDLVRNDLGRVARTGSVEVVATMEVKPFGSVQHLVSAVEAEVAPGAGLAAILRAALPGGSVTGAPKHAVCGHLAKAEAAPRGFYCGALGWIGPGGKSFDLAMPIRTAQIRGKSLEYWAGGGITRLSDPAAEWAELWLKAKALG